MLPVLVGQLIQPAPRFAMNIRIKAAAIHLGVSVLVAGITTIAVLGVMFPGWYAPAMGAYGLLGLILGCDVVTGPVLSLIVCTPGKPRRLLIMDYVVIVSLQLAVLIYGLMVIVDSRPVFTVFAVDRFNVVAASEIERGDLKEYGGTAPYTLSWHGPALVAVKMPQDAQGRNAVLELELSGRELQTLPRYFEPYSASDVLAKAEPLDKLIKLHPQLSEEISAIVSKVALRPDAVVWLPLQTRLGFHTVLLRRTDASFVGFLAADPY